VTRTTLATGALVICVVSNAAAQQPSDVVSVDHVRKALAQPAPKLTASLDRPAESKPTFTIVILEQQRFEHLLPPVLDFTAPVTPLVAPAVAGGTPPLVAGGISIDPRSIPTALRNAFARRAAQGEVRSSIATYCAAQPNSGAGILICDINSGRR
jgi:hypothetical protein